jgi:hypothetical protein
MLQLWDELFCQLFHGRWARVVSYSRLGPWACTKTTCHAAERYRRQGWRMITGRQSRAVGRYSGQIRAN